MNAWVAERRSIARARERHFVLEDARGAEHVLQKESYARLGDRR